METAKIKSFAREARLLLINGVSQRLKFWGFDEEGNNNQDLQKTQGGFIFRGQIFTDTNVPDKWKTLNRQLTGKQAVKDIVEQTAYTWFNRLIAIKILEQNGYIEPTLAYTKGMRTPQIVQDAKKGKHQLKWQVDKDLLLEYLTEDKEEEAFGLLIGRLCNTNSSLSNIFGYIDDFTEILLPQNVLQNDGLLDLINSDAISTGEYKEVELIGWLYQFYISDKKDEVFKGFKQNKKARAEDIPAATQIFTPKWIVKYMVENTVGKLYLDYEPDSELLDEMKYLVQNDDDATSSGVEKQAIISDITELTLIDPASGSGHILVTGFELLFKMYKEEGYTGSRAVDIILEHNLFGLDIDDRATQLARFAVLLKAAQYDADILKRGIIPKVYSFPEATDFSNNELQNFLGHEGYQFTVELKEALELLNQGKNIGSALKIKLSKEAQTYISKQYTTLSQKDNTAGGLNINQSGLWSRLQPFIDVLLVLTKKYTAVVANPPYMGQKSMNGELKNYLNSNYSRSKFDLFAVFMESMTGMLQQNARVGCITMESWMFLSSYEKLRRHILDNFSIASLAHFGWHIIGIAFGTATLILEKSRNLKQGEYSYLTINDVDRIKNEPYIFPKKDNGRYAIIPQTNFLKIPGSPIAYWVSDQMISVFEDNPILGNKHKPLIGMRTGNNEKYLRYWHEVDKFKTAFSSVDDWTKWFPYAKGGDFRRWFGNVEKTVNWFNDGHEIKEETIEKYPKLDWDNLGWKISNESFYFEEAISWTCVTGGLFSARFIPVNHLFDTGGSFISLTKISHSTKFYLMALLNSIVFQEILFLINPTINYGSGTVSKVPFIYADNESIDNAVNANIEISKKDWNSRETSWDFKKTPLLHKSDSLNQAYQKWQEEAMQDFFQLHVNEEKLNRIFIDIYGLQDQLTPEVALKDITILQDELAPRNQKTKKNQTEEEINQTWVKIEEQFREKGKNHIQLPFLKDRVIGQFLSYGVGIFMGRYRLDKPGLNIAHPNPEEEELANYTYNGETITIDDDSILPLMGEDCAFPDDVLLRTKDLIYAIWGEKTLTENINFVHETLGMDMHKWFTERFWKFHTDMYKKKPIYWLFSSNTKSPQKAAFKVLVYMHRMDKYTVQKIQRKYLHPHQEYIKKEIERLIKDEDSLNKQEIKQLEKLRNWELECRDYNEVLKQLAVQEIELDLDDGVSVNYEKFKGALAVIK